MTRERILGLWAGGSRSRTACPIAPTRPTTVAVRISPVRTIWSLAAFSAMVNDARSGSTVDVGSGQDGIGHRCAQHLVAGEQSPGLLDDGVGVLGA